MACDYIFLGDTTIDFGSREPWIDLQSFNLAYSKGRTSESTRLLRAKDYMKRVEAIPCLPPFSLPFPPLFLPLPPPPFPLPFSPPPPPFASPCPCPFLPCCLLLLPLCWMLSSLPPSPVPPLLLARCSPPLFLLLPF